MIEFEHETQRCNPLAGKGLGENTLVGAKFYSSLNLNLLFIHQNTKSLSILILRSIKDINILPMIGLELMRLFTLERTEL